MNRMLSTVLGPRRLMIRIVISQAAFDAIAVTMPLGDVSFESEIDEHGQRLTPFCLSSGDSRGVDFLAALRDEREDFSGEVALQGSNGVEFGMAFGKPASDVVLGPLVGS